jgi:hypothetical protein
MVASCFSRTWFSQPEVAVVSKDKAVAAKQRMAILQQRVDTILRVIGTEKDGKIRVLRAFEEVIAFVTFFFLVSSRCPPFLPTLARSLVFLPIISFRWFAKCLTQIQRVRRQICAVRWQR